MNVRCMNAHIYKSTYELCDDVLADLSTITSTAMKLQTYLFTKNYELCEDFLARTMQQTISTVGFSP